MIGEEVGEPGAARGGPLPLPPPSSLVPGTRSGLVSL